MATITVREVPDISVSEWIGVDTHERAAGAPKVVVFTPETAGALYRALQVFNFRKIRTVSVVAESVDDGPRFSSGEIR